MPKEFLFRFGPAALVTIVLFCTFLVWRAKTNDLPPPPDLSQETNTEEVTTPSVATSTREIIGQSQLQKDIVAYTFGTGDDILLLVGGIHGGYEWNSSLLAYTMIDALAAGEITIPENLTIAIIPDLNPDGTALITGKTGAFVAADVREPKFSGEGRFNHNQVDLNRNFACKWQPKSSWRGNEVNAGMSPFSEPESKALRDYVLTHKPVGVIFWHSQANAVYASECEEGILATTTAIMNTYAQAAKYRAVDTFDAYPVTGDAEGWLASIGIPAITVELETRNSIEWERNLAGVKALLDYYQN